MRSASFLPTPGIATRRTWSPSFNARDQVLRGDARKNIDRQLGPDSRDRQSAARKICFSAQILKAEKLQRVFAHMGMNLQAHRRADLRQAIKNIERNKNLIADAADVDDDFAGDFLR